MFRLSGADLRGFCNLLIHREGRRVLLSAVVSIGFLALVSTMFGQVIVRTEEMITLHEELDADKLRALWSTCMVPAVLLSTWFGFGGGRRLLFELPQLELLLTAPLRTGSLLLASLLRFSVLATVWCTALCGPLMREAGAYLHRQPSYLAIAIAMFALTTPVLGTLMVVQLVICRWFAGRISQLVLSVLSVAASSVFSLMLLLGALAQEDTVHRLMSLSHRRAAYPMLIENPARLLTGSAFGELGAGALAAALLLPCAAVLLLLAAAPIYRRAYANSTQAIEPLFRRSTRRSWPGGAAATMFRKELAQIVQQPSQLIGLLFSAIVIVVMAGSRFLNETILGAGDVPPMHVRHCFMMLGLWLFAQFTIAPSCLFRLTVSDGKQWPLYVGAPVPARTLLRGKLYLVALLQLWPAPVALLVGWILFGAGSGALWIVAALIPAVLMWTTALTAAVGTIPPLMRPDPERNNLLALVAVVIMLLALQLSAIPGVQVWVALCEYYEGHGALARLSEPQLAAVVIGFCWVLCGAASLVALAFGARNFARLAAPARS